MALKDRLESRRHPESASVVPSDGTLTVIDGARPEPTAAPEPQASPPDTGQKAGRLSPTLTTAKAAIHALLVERHAHEIDITDRSGVRSRIASLADEYAKSSGISFSRLDYGHVIDALLDEVLGLGPLQALLADPAVTEIMVNHPSQIYVERAGRVTLSPVVFESEAQLRLVIDRIVSTVGRRVDESSPMVDARLRDGSRVNVIIPPLAIDGPHISIRRFGHIPITEDDLLRNQTITQPMLELLRGSVKARLNVIISGG